MLFFRIHIFLKREFPYLLLAITICEVLKFDFCPTLFKAESQTFWFEDQILFILCFDKKKPVLKLLSLERVRRKLIIKCGHSKIFSGSNMYSRYTFFIKLQDS